MTNPLQAATRVPLLQVTKSAVATVGAWLVASLLLPGQLPVFGAVAALLVVQPSVNQSLGKAIERSIGVIVGVIIASGIGLVFGQTSWIVLLAIVVAIFAAWALRLTPGSANQVPISAMLVLSIGAATPDYALNRIIETVIGAVIGVIVNVAIVPPSLVAPAHDAIVRLRTEIAARLDALADALVTRQSPHQLEELLVTARLLRPMNDRAQSALVQGEESLTLNPRRSRLRELLERDTALARTASPLVTRVIGMTRALRDHYDDTLAAEPSVALIADELQRAAHDLRLQTAGPLTAGASDADPDASAGEPPALTAPLSIGPPASQHWVLLGSLLEDLRRVHEEITED